MEIDHKELLIKYIKHIGEHEGTDYLGFAWGCEDAFTPEENAELLLLSEEADK